MKNSSLQTHAILSSLFAGFAFISPAWGKTIPNYATANLVLGQPNFTSTSQLTTVTGLGGPNAVAMDPITHKIFVTDSSNNRVLRYGSADSLTDGVPAEAVLGQANFTTFLNPSPPNNKSMSWPTALFVDHQGRLWVIDSENHRVLGFDNASAIPSNSPATRLYGQPNFSTKTPGTAAEKLNFPYSAWVDRSDRLWIADGDNNRVLRFDAVSNKPNGAPANGVLGQENFTTSAGISSMDGMVSPRGVAISPSGALFVSCVGDHRILRFDGAAALGNGANASAVLGQENFTATASGLSAVKMNYPYGLTVTPDDSLWVCDSSNHRLIRFDQASSKTNGAAATGVIGQPDFSTNAASTTAQGLKSPASNPFVDSTGSLWVSDSTNNRVLRFPADASRPVVELITKVKKKPVTKKSVTLQGTASDPNGISLVQYQVNQGKLKIATGTTAWKLKTKLKKGKNKVTVIATDPWGDASVKKIIKIKRK
jgi:sugar lactone lactonase YvrE